MLEPYDWNKLDQLVDRLGFYLNTAAAIQRGATTDEAVATALEIERQRGLAEVPATSQAPSGSAKMVLEYAPDSVRGKLNYQGAITSLRKAEAAALQALAASSPVSTEQMREIISAVDPSLEGTQHVYNVLRDLKVALARIGLPDVIASKKGHGYWLERAIVEVKGTG